MKLIKNNFNNSFTNCNNKRFCGNITILDYRGKILNAIRVGKWLFHNHSKSRYYL